jgi:hypothetical protein
MKRNAAFFEEALGRARGLRIFYAKDLNIRH